MPLSRTSSFAVHDPHVWTAAPPVDSHSEEVEEGPVTRTPGLSLVQSLANPLGPKAEKLSVSLNIAKGHVWCQLPCHSAGT